MPSIKGLLITAAVSALMIALYHNGVLAPVPGFSGDKKA